jgi:hypothetical protein
MHASSHRFALAFAGSIGEVLPLPLSIRAAGNRLDLYANGELIGGSAAAVIVEAMDDRSPDERLVSAALAVLGGIQDCVSYHLMEQWPADGAGQMAVPGARTDAHRVYLWYGSSEAAAVLTLTPVELVEINTP